MKQKDNELKQKFHKQLLKALEYLDYSYAKVQQLPEKISELDAETLETWESFSARFSRVADIYLSKYIRAVILADDPGFNGSFRDFMNRAEKLRLIDQVDTWMSIRSLRNLSVHEYAEEDMTEYFQNLKKYTPKLLGIKDILKAIEF